MLTHKITTVVFMSILLMLGLAGIFTEMNVWYFVAVAVLWFFVVSVGSFSIGSNFHVKAYCSNPREEQNNIALTFDDGPNENTLRILDILLKNNTKAAFFCIGQRIEKHPEIFSRIVDEGHIVGNHSYTHSPLIDFYRTKRMIRELQDTDDLIEKYSGKKPLFFRPPYGVTNPSIRRALKATQHIVIGWNIRSLDGILDNKKIIFNRIISRLSPGAIILLHDTKPETANVLEQLLSYAAKKNFNWVSLEQLLNLKAYEN
jgi:peptidoglycan/xylan/chitin deacetylase (PgdA/CDA1 family)